MAFAEEFNERGAFCCLEDGCELHLRGCVVNVVEQVRDAGGRRELGVSRARMTGDRAMSKINYDAGSKRRGRSDGRWGKCGIIGAAFSNLGGAQFQRF